MEKENPKVFIFAKAARIYYEVIAEDMESARKILESASNEAVMYKTGTEVAGQFEYITSVGSE